MSFIRLFLYGQCKLSPVEALLSSCESQGILSCFPLCVSTSRARINEGLFLVCRSRFISFSSGVYLNQCHVSKRPLFSSTALPFHLNGKPLCVCLKLPVILLICLISFVDSTSPFHSTVKWYSVKGQARHHFPFLLQEYIPFLNHLDSHTNSSISSQYFIYSYS